MLIFLALWWSDHIAIQMSRLCYTGDQQVAVWTSPASWAYFTKICFNNPGHRSHDTTKALERAIKASIFRFVSIILNAQQEELVSRFHNTVESTPVTAYVNLNLNSRNKKYTTSRYLLSHKCLFTAIHLTLNSPSINFCSGFWKY